MSMTVGLTQPLRFWTDVRSFLHLPRVGVDTPLLRRDQTVPSRPARYHWGNSVQSPIGGIG